MSVEPPAKGTFQVGDLVRNTSAAYHEKERIVRQINPIEDDEPMLIVRQDEDDPKSILWSWHSFMCKLVKAAPVFNVHDSVTLGTGNVVREVKDTRIHNKTGEMQYRVDVDGEKEKWVIAAALHPAPVADNLKATESAGGMKISDLWDLSAPAGGDTDALYQASLKLAEAQQFQKDAEERAVAAEKLVAKLEQIIRNHEAYAKQPQPIPSAQPVCYEIKTITHRVDLPESDVQYARHLNEGWKENDIATNITSGDVIMRTITFKKMVDTPPQPERGTAGHHATLTASYVGESRSPFRTPQHEPVEVPAVGTLVVESKKEIKLGPIGTSIKEIGVEATGQMMTSFAIQEAFERGRERVNAMPAFNRSLHQLTEGN